MLANIIKLNNANLKKVFRKILSLIILKNIYIL